MEVEPCCLILFHSGRGITTESFLFWCRNPPTSTEPGSISGLRNNSQRLACGSMASLRVHTEAITVRTAGKGTYEMTDQISEVLIRSGIVAGTLTVFVQHTSCS